MTPERMQQIEAVFHGACEHAPEEQPAFLNEACGADDALRREVEALLAADGQAGSLLAAPAYAAVAPLLAASATPPLPGQTIGHYQIIAPLGQGGMGEVYRARDLKLDRTVALKVLPAEFAADTERLRRFIREAKAASTLNHPHVATIYEIGAAQFDAHSLNFIVMEYVAGQTLAAKINGQPLPVSEIVELAAQIVDALSEAHGNGITHRDIKPANVMLNERGQVKVLDFGLAKFSRPATPAVGSGISTLVPTTPGVVLGTVPYMSPEQALGREVDQRSDLFSLGVVLYEMATGRLPFAGATTSETLDRILHAQPEAIGQLNTGAPAELERIVQKCLEKERERRYQSAQELLADLMNLQHSSPTTAPAAAPVTTQRRSAVSRRYGVALAVMLLLLSTLAVFLFTQRVEPKVQAIKKLAVLPPRPLQASGRDEALEAGTANMLITRLSSLRQLIVRSESAVARYSRPDQDPLAAGREQEVDAVFDIRYQRSGDKLRFTLRLLRIADGASLWADTLDQPAADLFAIQDALSAKVTSALNLRLNDAEKELLANRYTSSAEAWKLYDRGCYLVTIRNKPGLLEAMAHFERAIKLDPNFALAYSQLGYAYLSLSNLGIDPPKEIMPKVKEAIDQALKVNDQLAEAHSFLAVYKAVYEWDHKGAEQEHQRAIELDPNSAQVHVNYAFYLAYMGRLEQAVLEARTAEELDPTDRFNPLMVAKYLYNSRRYDEAIEQSNRLLAQHPNWPSAHNFLFNSYREKRDEQRAFNAFVKQMEAAGASAEAIYKVKAFFAQEGLKGIVRRELNMWLERERGKGSFVDQFQIARRYAYLGQKEEALARLEKMIEDRPYSILQLNIEPEWDSIRDDPRFVAMVRRVGLAPYS